MYLQCFNNLKTKIGNEVQDPAKMEVMIFLVRLDERMRLKICEHSYMSGTKHNLIAFMKILRLNFDYEPKPFLLMRS